MEEIVIKYFSNLSFNEFSEIKEIKQLSIDENELKIIYHILIENLFVLTDHHYLPVLFNYLKTKTSTSTCLKFKDLFVNDYFNISMNV